MRTIFLSCLLFVACLMPASAEDRRYVSSPNDGYLNLREGPGVDNPIIMRMLNGEEVTVIRRSGSWGFVEHESGETGWASTKYLVRQPRAASTPRLMVVRSISDGYLNLRTGPGTRFRIVREMYNGETVRILERSGSWVRVRHQSGDVGWASRKYMVRAR